MFETILKTLINNPWDSGIEKSISKYFNSHKKESCEIKFRRSDNFDSISYRRKTKNIDYSWKYEQNVDVNGDMKVCDIFAEFADKYNRKNSDFLQYTQTRHWEDDDMECSLRNENFRKRN